MKKYTINYCFDANISVEVLADSEEEAIRKAEQVDIEREDLELERNEETILEAIDVPNLQTLIEQAEGIVKEADKEDTEIKLNSWPYVTLEYWTGVEMEHKKYLMENLYWDYERDEIGFNTAESAGDFGLSEIPDIEQFYVCQAIINSQEGGHNA